MLRFWRITRCTTRSLVRALCSLFVFFFFLIRTMVNRRLFKRDILQFFLLPRDFRSTYFIGLSLPSFRPCCLFFGLLESQTTWETLRLRGRLLPPAEEIAQYRGPLVVSIFPTSARALLALGTALRRSATTFHGCDALADRSCRWWRSHVRRQRRWPSRKRIRLLLRLLLLLLLLISALKYFSIINQSYSTFPVSAERLVSFFFFSFSPVS